MGITNLYSAICRYSSRINRASLASVALRLTLLGVQIVGNLWQNRVPLRHCQNAGFLASFTHCVFWVPLDWIVYH